MDTDEWKTELGNSFKAFNQPPGRSILLVSRGTVAYFVAFALLLSWALFVQADTRRVDGHSMLPTLEGGDLLVIQNMPINQIHLGDIIVYNSLCSTEGESVVHRVVEIASAGLVTKGDNNQYTDVAGNIASGPITQSCLEGKVVFVIPYVELLAYYVDLNGLPRWFNYVPSMIILAIVFASMIIEGKDRETKEGVAENSLWWIPLIVIGIDVVLLAAEFLVVQDLSWRASYASTPHVACRTLCSFTPSFSIGLLTRLFTMTGNGVSLTSPQTLDWIQLLTVSLIALNTWLAFAAVKRWKVEKAGKRMAPSAGEEMHHVPRHRSLLHIDDSVI